MNDLNNDNTPIFSKINELNNDRATQPCRCSPAYSTPITTRSGLLHTTASLA
jgi:hypothetical protein